jgi:uncharacterized protein (TIGR04255 family)
MLDRALPSFTKPPVTEVVLGASFRTLDDLTLPLIGRLWAERLADHFPRSEEQPPYEPPIEVFDPGPTMPPFTLQFGSAFPRPRVWFVSDEGDEVLQIQRDYFACNWRKVHPEAAYGRWGSRRESFSGWLKEFETFVEEHGVGKLDPVQCEVSYINHIEPNNVWGDHSRISDVFTLAGDPELTGDEFALAFEQETINAQVLMVDHGQPFGRLHISVQPAFRRGDNLPIYVLDLTARGAPLGDGVDGVLEFMEKGRIAIVRSFAALTTPAMHDQWGAE